MAGVAVPNLATFFQAPSGQRATVSGADWAGGMNKGGSNAPGVGINTGDYSPKSSDWSEDERLDYESGQLGQAKADITPVSTDFTSVSFVQTDGEIAPGAELVALSDVYNLTGKTIPEGAWAWGGYEDTGEE
jgi:hypothetical protein